MYIPRARARTHTHKYIMYLDILKLKDKISDAKYLSYD